MDRRLACSRYRCANRSHNHLASIRLLYSMDADPSMPETDSRRATVASNRSTTSPHPDAAHLRRYMSRMAERGRYWGERQSVGYPTDAPSTPKADRVLTGAWGWIQTRSIEGIEESGLIRVASIVCRRRMSQRESTMRAALTGLSTVASDDASKLETSRMINPTSTRLP